MILINLGGGWFGLVCLKCFSSAPDRRRPAGEGATKRSRDRYRRRPSLPWKRKKRTTADPGLGFGNVIRSRSASVLVQILVV